jgi:hypothetical protein
MITTSANQAGTEGRFSAAVCISIQQLDTISRETSDLENMIGFLLIRALSLLFSACGCSSHPAHLAGPALNVGAVPLQDRSQGCHEQGPDHFACLLSARCASRGLFREFGAARLLETTEKMEPSVLFLLREGKSFVMKVPQLSPRAVFIAGSWGSGSERRPKRRGTRTSFHPSTPSQRQALTSGYRSERPTNTQWDDLARQVALLSNPFEACAFSQRRGRARPLHFGKSLVGLPLRSGVRRVGEASRSRPDRTSSV